MSTLLRQAVSATSVLFLAIAGSVLVAAPAAAASFDATDETTLVDAINAANGTPEADVITISAVDILLTADLPTITGPLTITGAGLGLTSINGNNLYTIFTVNSGGELVLIEELLVGRSIGDGIFSTNSDLWLRNFISTESNDHGLDHDGGNLTLHRAAFTSSSNDGVNANLTGSDSLIVQDESLFTGNDGDGFQLFSDSAVTGIFINSEADGNEADGFDIEVDGSGQVTLTNVTADSNFDANFELNSSGVNSYIGLNQVNALNSANSAGVVAIASDGGTIAINRLTAGNNHSSGIAASSGGGGVNRVQVDDSSLTGNGNPGWDGGGLQVGEGSDLYVTVTGTSITGNFASTGGGIYAALAGGSGLTVTNSTISSNLAGVGGGIYVVESDEATGDERFLLRNSTVYDNSGESMAGGVARFGVHSTITNTSIGGNSSIEGTDDLAIDGEIFANYNLIQTVSNDAFVTGEGNLFGIAPALGTFDDNGGFTRTHAPLEGSPLINAGTPVFGDPTTTDQRGDGFDRISDGRIDIGAVEIQVAGPVPTGEPDPSALPPTGVRSMEGFVYAIVVLGFGMLLLAGAAWRKSRSLA